MTDALKASLNFSKARDYLSPLASKWFFASQLVGLILLQWFVVPSAADGIELTLPFLLIGIAVVSVTNKIAFNPIRLTLLAIFLVLALATQILSGVDFSGPGVFLLVGLYLPMCVTIDIHKEDYLAGLNMFQNAMLVVLVIVIGQHITQVLFSWRLWPNLMTLAPDPLHLHGYNYLQPLKYGSPYEKPQGIFFLESSFLSQFAALAFIIEIVLFRRLWRLGAYVALVMLSFAGTGILMLVICAPLLLARAGPRLALSAAAAGVLIGAIAVGSGWFAQVQDRIFEVQNRNSSGYARFVSPMVTLGEITSDPKTLLIGKGAGSFPHTVDIPMPLMKVAYEYGTLPMLAFGVFLIFSHFDGVPSKRIAFGCLVYYLYGGGGLLMPVYVVPSILFATLFRIVPTRALVPERARDPRLRVAQAAL